MPKPYDLSQVKYRIVERRMMKPRDLLPSPAQWRDHTKAQADAMYGVLTDIGITDTLKAWYSERAGGKLVTWDGHLRESLDPDKEWPVDITDLTDAEADYALGTHDPVAAMAQTDQAAFQALRETIQTSNAAVLQMLKDTANITADIFAGRADGAETNPDAGAQLAQADALQATWQTAPGQTWGLGDSRLYCGDCRDPAAWAKLLADGAPLAGIFTSPPYAEQRQAEYGGVPMDQYVAWWDHVQALARDHLAPDGSFFVNLKPHCEAGARVLYVMDLVLAMCRTWGWTLVDELCWLHIAMPGSWPNRFKNEFEPIYQFARTHAIKFRPEHVKYASPDSFSGPGGAGDGYGKGRLRQFRAQMTVTAGPALPSNVLPIHIDVAKATVHAAQFPVGLPTFFLQAYSDPGDLWCDPFCGSGTTIIAAEQQGRRAIGIELKPECAAICLDRYQRTFNQEPELLAED